MKWLFFFAALLIATPVLAQSAAPAGPGPSTAMTPAPDDRAKQWLSLVDDSNYSEAWRQAGDYMRSRASAEQFQTQVGGVREPLGAMATRTIKSVQMTKTLPGMRDGQYAVVQFDSSFAHKASAVETVALTSEKGGWSVVGYHIN
jgi:Protein of unknown function (DUF4019)